MNTEENYGCSSSWGEDPAVLFVFHTVHSDSVYPFKKLGYSKASCCEFSTDLILNTT